MSSVHFGHLAIRVRIPPELDNEVSFLDYLDVSAAELNKIWWYRERMYHRFYISKGRGRTRTINAPDKRLKHLQRKIAPLLSELYRVRNPVHGFVADKSIKTNALAHIRKPFVLNVDLKTFFPSISERRVVGLLESLGVCSRVSAIIARICCYDSHLPQGAPTSPILSNMICFRMDRELLGLAKKERCIYTRYADDITFSSYQPLTSLFDGTPPPAGNFDPEVLSTDLRRIISGNGFRLNSRKANYADRHSRRTVTGLKINEFINVDRRYVRNIRAAIYSIETLGLEDAQKKFETTHGGSSSLAAHLEGKIIWLRHIRGHSDPVFRAIALRFNRSFPDRQIGVTPTMEEVLDRSVWVAEHFEGEMAQGTAFFLKGVGLVTAAHVVNGADEVTVFHPSKPSNNFKVKILQIDEDRDLAILSHEIPDTEYYELERASDAVKVSDQVTALGFPGFGPGDKLNVREGTVSSHTTKSGLRLVEVTQKLIQGMSGGPLVNKMNALVGIIHKGGPYEGRDFAVSIEELTSWTAKF